MPTRSRDFYSNIEIALFPYAWYSKESSVLFTKARWQAKLSMAAESSYIGYSPPSSIIIANEYGPKAESMYSESFSAP